MKSSILARLATSGALFALTTVGCSTIAPSQLSSAASTSPKPAKSAAKAQAKAAKALAKGRNDDAIGYAEAAVLTDPDNAELRALFGQSYMAAGRFSSAGESFREAITLGRTDARSVIGLALAETAQGHVGDARQLLDAHRDILPVADYGLALALTGDATSAVQILTDAIRSDQANIKTRQNLALAYALDGRWREARIMAAQDMSEDQVQARIASWAQMARPGAYETRVAGLLGVVPMNDIGRPVGVALDFSAPRTEQMAAASLPPSETPLPAIGPAPLMGSMAMVEAREPDVSIEPDMASQQAAAELIPVQAAAASPVAAIVADAARPVPTIKASAEPVKIQSQPAIAAPARLQLASVTPAPGVALKPSGNGITGTHLVQIGAFSSPQNAAKAWDIYRRRYPTLKRFESASGRITVKGTTLYRLAAMGFDDAASARSLCSSLRSEGGKCIVRNMRGSGSVQYAAGTMGGRVLASR